MTQTRSTTVPAPDTRPMVMWSIDAALPWLPELSPQVRLHPASSGAQYTRAVRAVGRDAADWAVGVGNVVAQRVAAEIPGHVAEDGLEVLRMGTESTTLQLLVALAGGEIESAVTPESLGGIPEFVRRRVSLDDMLRGIRLGHSVIAAAFLAECGQLGDAGQRHEQMRALSERMFVFFDLFSTQMAAAYHEEAERWARSDAAGRLAMAKELLHGTDDPPDTASRRLRYELDRSHVALVVWSSARTLDADPDALHGASCELLRRAGCEQRLVLTVGHGTVWAWATPSDPATFEARLAQAALPSDTHAVTGGRARGLAGFRSSHAEAQAAFALLSQREPAASTVTPYHDVDLVSLLLADRERALRFARRELGPLAQPSAVNHDLRRTLAVYLDEGGSPQAAARRLVVSRNTVSYRVRRAEELLGRPIGPRRRHLQAALEILEECGC